MLLAFTSFVFNRSGRRGINSPGESGSTLKRTVTLAGFSLFEAQRNLFRDFESGHCFCPVGTTENSPAIHCQGLIPKIGSESRGINPYASS